MSTHTGKNPTMTAGEIVRLLGTQPDLMLVHGVAGIKIGGGEARVISVIDKQDWEKWYDHG